MDDKYLDSLVDYAMRFVGTPYIYGGSHPCSGLDCSGFVQHLMRAVGSAPKGDLTAQMLMDYYILNGKESGPQKGALAFYGNGERVSHISFFINDLFILEAGGGDSTTTDIQRAIAKEAFIRMRPYDHRKDLLKIIMPKYRFNNE